MYYSKRERKFRRRVKSIAIFLISLFVLVGSIIYFSGKSHTPATTQYTAEEMLHDHNGDGVPDH
ncbi:hypothetical protein I5677_07060 [Mobilitalea sibirica]|uniref:Uncharacterized protein n=1 Tax=Mobilitalea sibirica TaxID=1462919 RepID=A0A8J7GYL7_9FIRM|nr:hypothetical protein [Mobilitalea sibirica]MBH1940644.1 hypothetical protein [Mobilitalea sibirica]